MSAHNREATTEHLATAELQAAHGRHELARTEAALAQAHAAAELADQLEELVRIFRPATCDKVAYAPVTQLPMRPDSKDRTS